MLVKLLSYRLIRRRLKMAIRSKLLKLRPSRLYPGLQESRCHGLPTPTNAAEAQLLMNAMREDALARVGIDVKMEKLVVSSYLDWQTDQDCDLVFPVSSRPDLLARCRHELSGQPAGSLAPHRTLSRHSDYSPADTVRVFQWNVLAQALCVESDKFLRCSPLSLDWKYRRWRMIQEILRYSPDLICLQEVDHPRLLLRALKSVGYSGQFVQKPDSPCIYMKGSNGPDGCAIFYKDSKFDQIRSNTRVLKVWNVNSNQVIIAVILRSKASGQEIVVCTTHLKAKLEALRSSFRTEQSKDILTWLESVRGGRPVILTGDLNGLPSEEFYSVLTGSPALPLVSSYRVREEDIRERVGRLEYTTWKIREEQGEQKHILDYILHTPGQLLTINTLDVPDGDQIGEDRLPSPHYASDHISLVADIALLSYIN